MEKGNRLGRDPGPSKNASQTGTIDIDKEPTTQGTPEPRTLPLQLPSPDETSSTSESSPCQKIIEPHILDFSVDGNFDFNQPFEPLQVFFDDIAFDGIADPSLPIAETHQQALDGKDILTNSSCCLNQLDTGSLTAVYDSTSTSPNGIIITPPEARSATLVGPAETPGSTTAESLKPAATTKLSSPLFSVNRFSDIAPSKLHQLILQISPEAQPDLRLPPTFGETHDSDQCICPALVGALQVFVSSPALCAGPQGLISLDLLLLLDDQLWQTQDAISKCRSCGQLPSYSQKMTLCMMADWMIDNWQRYLQQRLIRRRSTSYIRNCEEVQQQQPLAPAGTEPCCLRLGPTRIDDMTWRVCVQDLVKLRLIRLTRIIKSISSEAGYFESSRNKKSTLKLGIDTLKQEANSKIEMVLGMMDSCKA